MWDKRVIFLLFILLMIFVPESLAQRKVKIIRNDYMEGGRKDGRRYNKAVGDVLFLQEMTEIYCDSAYFYRRDNSIEAFGHIRIFDRQDSSEIFADFLKYDGDDLFVDLDIATDTEIFQDLAHHLP